MKFTILASTLADRDVLRRAERLAERFNLEPMVVTDPEDVPNSPTVALVATGGTEDAIEALLERSPAVLLLHWHSYNSLAAALEVGVSTLHVGRAEEAMRAFKRLVGTRILVVGGKCSWIRGPDPSDLPYLRTVEIDLEDVKSVDPDGSFEENLRAHDIDPSELNHDFLDLAGKLHAVLSRHGADAITGDCFSLYEEFGAVPCLYFSALDVPYCCEGDPAALVTTLLTPARIRPFIGNVIELDRYGTRLAHCACPLELLREFEVVDHMETGAPHAVKGVLPTGKCMLARYPYAVGASIVETRWRDDQCRVQARLLVEEEFEPLGNHHCVALGVSPDLVKEIFEAVHLNPSPSSE
ncbi:hypothetical protein [Methanopyrus sp. SNP6]|uniref:hypothetical protein n=1 Tax=Methanopyrus sp. SNP6 TaxID=1937005 RepID=UPI0011E5CF97|nr:hypothetical protein [Methanopyrus sp. SNP6]